MTVVDNVIGGWTFDALNEHDSAPPSMKIRTTDAAGRFEFTGMPGNCRFRIDVRAKGFPDRWIHAATTREPQPAHDGGPVFTGDFKVTLTTPVDVPIKIVYGDTGQPAPKVLVQAAEGLVNTSQTSDDQGRVVLKVPPGTYRLQNLPARGTPYLVTEGQLVVKAKPPAEPVAATVRPAAIVEVTVVDAETGAGLPDVDLWEQIGPGPQRETVSFRSWEVATRIAWVERPRTDARGNSAPWSSRASTASGWDGNPFPGASRWSRNRGRKSTAVPARPCSSSSPCGRAGESPADRPRHPSSRRGLCADCWRLDERVHRPLLDPLIPEYLHLVYSGPLPNRMRQVCRF